MAVFQVTGTIEVTVTKTVKAPSKAAALLWAENGDWDPSDAEDYGAEWSFKVERSEDDGDEDTPRVNRDGEEID